MSLSLADLRAMPHTSVSQLKTFLSCPKKYTLQYVDRLEPAFRPIAFPFGTAFHEAIAAYFTTDAGLDSLNATFRDSLTVAVNADGPPVLFDEDEADLSATIDVGVKMVATFVAKIARPSMVLGVEVPFALELAHPITGEVAPLPLVGAIDALVEENGQVGVLEVKTAKRRWTIDALEFDVQPTAYAMAARALGSEEPALSLLIATKMRVPDVQVEQVVRHRRDEAELAEMALTVIRATEAGIDHRVRGWACKSCPYAGACGA